MTIERDMIRGCWVISDIVHGYLEVRRYYYYTLREAVRLFRADVLAK